MDEDFNFKTFLENKGFKEYSKIESAIATKEVTLDDIVDCNDIELKQVLESFDVKLIQRNRFVKAIKILKESSNENDKETGLPKTKSFLHQLQKIRLEKSSLWAMGIVNVDDLQGMIDKTTEVFLH